jgi:hypothetical protein
MNVFVTLITLRFQNRLAKVDTISIYKIVCDYTCHECVDVETKCTECLESGHRRLVTETCPCILRDLSIGDVLSYYEKVELLEECG